MWDRNRTNAVLLFALILGIVGTAQSLFAEYKAVDQRIWAAVTEELSTEARFQNLRVEVENMTVRLRGSVPVLEDKRQALQKAQKPADVRMIISHIVLETEKVPDTLLLRRLRERLAEAQDSTISLKVKRGGVTIQGTVEFEAQRERVLSTVASTSGVLWIEDRLQILTD